MNKPIDTQIVEKEILAKITHFLPSHFEYPEYTFTQIGLATSLGSIEANNLKQDFFEVMHRSNIVYDVDWNEFVKENASFFESKTHLNETHDFEFVRNYLTAITRGERFSENLIITEGKSGRIYSALRCLAKHYGWEAHPYLPFVPAEPTTLILGSFPGRHYTRDLKTDAERDDWFYGNSRNKFWSLIAESFNSKIPETKKEKKELLSANHMILFDIVGITKRRHETNLDKDLEVLGYNDYAINQLLSQNTSIGKIFTTSKFVKDEYNKQIKPNINNNLEIVPLPSPSPIFRKMTYKQKLAVYKKELNAR